MSCIVISTLMHECVRVVISSNNQQKYVLSYIYISFTEIVNLNFITILLQIISFKRVLSHSLRKKIIIAYIIYFFTHAAEFSPIICSLTYLTKDKVKSFPGEGEEKKDDFSSKDLQEYADLFPFENLVFGGGGAKGVAYPGSLQVLYMSRGIGIIFY